MEETRRVARPASVPSTFSCSGASWCSRRDHDPSRNLSIQTSLLEFVVANSDSCQSSFSAPAHWTAPAPRGTSAASCSKMKNKSKKSKKHKDKKPKERKPKVNLPVPVTLLSGFLGSGKTTLLKHLLEEKETHNLKVAVLVNDMAELNIDAALVKNTKMIESEEAMVEMHNGCICCSLREDLLIELTKLAVAGDVDAIIVESTGVSEPQQVGETFVFPLNPEGDEDDGHDHEDGGEKNEFELAKEKERAEKLDKISDILEQAEEILGKPPSTLSDIARLDTCVTVVDCKAFSGNLTSPETLMERYNDVDKDDDRNVSTLLIDQLEFANVILLNKTDLVDESEVMKIKGAMIQLNPTAKIHLTKHAKVDLKSVVMTNFFDMDEAMDSPGWLKSLREEMIPETEEYGISSFVYRARTPFHPNRLLDFLETIFYLELVSYEEVDEEEEEENKEEENEEEKAERNAALARCVQFMKETYGSIYRSKGFIWVAGRDQLFGEWSQAGMMVEITRGAAWIDNLPPEYIPDKDSKSWEMIQKDIQEGIVYDRRQELVFIGSDLNKEAITKALDECLLRPEEENKEKEYEFPPDAKEDDVKEHGWKFGWKPKEGEEVRLPEWPAEIDEEDEDEDNEDADKEKD